MKVVGTAGHIDHGKSTLVRRLTGIDPDRLAEEKLRGMTIDLGFAWLTLPSGTDISIVDVPGHERFVKNMLAGAGGVDVALIIVAADEAVMPQTREHLDILDLLEVRYGVVALTKSDLVDPELLALAESDVVDSLQGTGLEGSTIVPVSSTTGAGLTSLLAALDQAVSLAPEHRDRGMPYVPIDRIFTVPGFGTVVTGTLHDGMLAEGESVEIVPSGLNARIRGLQTHQAAVARAEPGSRVAVNLPGIRTDQIVRGDLLARPSTVRGVRRFDARMRVVPSAPFALAHGVSVSAHIGSAERTAVLSVLDRDRIEPGESALVQLRFTDPVAAVRGQKFVVRLPAPARTVAGGTVLDVHPRHRRTDRAAIQRLELLDSGSLDAAILGIVHGKTPKTAEEIATAIGMQADEVAEILLAMTRDGRLVSVGRTYMGAATVDELADRAGNIVQQYHHQFPVRRGIPREELRRRLGAAPEDWNALVAVLASRGALRDEGSVIAHQVHEGGSVSRPEEAERVLALLMEEPFAPPSIADLLRIARTDMSLVAALIGEGKIVRVADDIVFSREAYDRMVRLVLDLIRGSGGVSVAEVRDALGTSRKYALAFLEHLDGQRITKRTGDKRTIGSKAPICA
jgi:selenocysteine-specific elongation factor